MSVKSWGSLLEPEANQVMGGELMAQVSTAISLKRIADALERQSQPYITNNMVMTAPEDTFLREGFEG